MCTGLHTRTCVVSLTPQRVLPNRYPLHCWPMFSSATSQPPSAAVPQRSCCQRACCPAHPHHAGQQHTDSCSGPADLQSWPPSTDCSPRADRRTQPPRTQPYIKCTAAMIFTSLVWIRVSKLWDRILENSEPENRFCFANPSTFLAGLVYDFAQAKFSLERRQCVCADLNLDLAAQTHCLR